MNNISFIMFARSYTVRNRKINFAGPDRIYALKVMSSLKKNALHHLKIDSMTQISEDKYIQQRK